MIDLKGSKIFITGGAGFVGSFITEQLLEQGVGRIVILDNFIRGSKENIKGALATGHVECVEGDIRDIPLLNQCMQGSDYCFHMAALRITQCASEPREALEVMYHGSFNVLDACVKHGIKKVVLASSASVYGQADHFPTKEDHHPYNNQTLYGSAKTANELMCRSFYHMHGLKYNIPRYFNIYGPRMDTYGKYTEVLIRWYHLIKEGKPPVIFGAGDQTMDFVYIEDIARASILALQSDVFNEVFNVARGEETSLKQLCHLLLEVMGSNLKPEYKAMPADRKKVEVHRRLADVSKAKNLLGFQAQVELRQGLEKLVQWLDQQTPVRHTV